MSDNKQTKPISIPARQRERSVSFSSSSGSDDSNSPPLRTPLSANPPKLQATVPAPVSPSTSPILSYFFASPPKTASGATATTPGSLGSFGRSFAAKQPSTDVVLEEEEDSHIQDADFEPLLVRHARRLSTGWQTQPRLAQPPSGADGQNDRGAALLRRLSLGSALVRPQVSNVNPPPPTPATLTPQSPQRTKTPPRQPPSALAAGRKTRRSATISVAGDARPRRAPSPMGERILKGHFDGFN